MPIHVSVPGIQKSVRLSVVSAIAMLAIPVPYPKECHDSSIFHENPEDPMPQMPKTPPMHISLSTSSQRSETSCSDCRAAHVRELDLVADAVVSEESHLGCRHVLDGHNGRIVSRVVSPADLVVAVLLARDTIPALGVAIVAPLCVDVHDITCTGIVGAGELEVIGTLVGVDFAVAGEVGDGPVR